jgi:hypothetical protein
VAGVSARSIVRTGVVLMLAGAGVLVVALTVWPG